MRDREERPADDTQSHAREIPPLPKDVSDRVAFIADMMQSLEWVRGKSAKVLAAAWGVSRSTIENYSAEASRLVTGDPEEARRDITIGARRLFWNAVDGNDAKGAAMVGKLWADVSGANAPTQTNVSLGAPTPETAAAAVRAAFGNHAAMSDDAASADADGTGGAGAVPKAPSQ